jgi:hypothetical protein
MSNPLVSANALQLALNDNFTQNDPSQRSENLGLLHYLFSPANLSGIQRLVAPGNGKLKNIQLVFQNRDAESTVETAIAKKCVSTNEDAEQSVTYTLDETQGVSSDCLIDITHLARATQSNPYYLAQQIQKRMDVCKRKMATLAVQALDGIKGSFASGELNVTSGVKSVKTKKTDGTLSTDLLEQTTFACMNAGYQGSPIMIGWGEAWQYFKRLNAGCCALDGVNVGDLYHQNELIMLGDRRITDVYPDTTHQGYYFTMEQGAIQPVWWNEFEGVDGINHIDESNYKQTVLVDPISGIPFDFILSNNCGKISIQTKLAIKFIGLPNNLFATGDVFNGVTFVNKFQIVNS